MGNKSSFMLQDEEITQISEETGFSPAQIERLYSRFTALDKSNNGSLSRQDCLAIPELAINPLCERIVHMFFIDCDDDHDRINFCQFMKVLATFRSSHAHRSSPLNRSRDASRQESLNQQQQQQLVKQASLLFDSIDPLPFSSALSRHSRHSSYHDGFHNINNHHHHQHHTTNQHSFHYAASTTHLPLAANSHHHHHHSFHHHNNNHLHQNGLSSNSHSISNHLNHLKHSQLPLVDPDEPPNSQKQKLYFMFKVYDVNDDDFVCLEDLVAVLKMMVGTYVDEIRVRKIAERTLREADKDCDNLISFEEFCDAFTRKDIDDLLRVKFSSSS